MAVKTTRAVRLDGKHVPAGTILKYDPCNLVGAGAAVYVAGQIVPHPGAAKDREAVADIPEPAAPAIPKAKPAASTGKSKPAASAPKRRRRKKVTNQ